MARTQGSSIPLLGLEAGTVFWGEEILLDEKRGEGRCPVFSRQENCPQGWNSVDLHTAY